MTENFNEETFEHPAFGEEETGKIFSPTLEGFEGPLDLLLALVREQQLDIGQISVATLAEQYSAFLVSITPEELQRAAEYLLMASWLAMLKSRLLLPEQEPEDGEDDPVVMAERLALHMRRLSAMQDVARALQDLPQLGQNFFVAGDPQEIPRLQNRDYMVDVMGLLRAIRRVEERISHSKARLRVSELPVLSIEVARAQLQVILRRLRGWCDLEDVLTQIQYSKNKITSENSTIYKKSCKASTFMAALEMQREGSMEIRQDSLQSPLQIKNGQNATYP